MRRRHVLVLALALAVSASVAWLWPMGLVAHRLGPFAFRAPRAAIGPAASSELAVCLVTEPPSPVTEIGTITVDGFEGWIERTAVLAPVAGGDPRATDVRDRGIRIWFPALERGLYASWRTFGGGYSWLRDRRLTRAAAELVASLQIDV